MDTNNTASRSYAVNGKITLSSALVLFSVICAVIFLHAYSRCRRHRHRHRHRGTHQHLRNRNTGGLDPTVLAALPTFPHSSSDGGECAVCLSELEPGDELRVLPRCRHVFHSACIDAWFRSHSDCPLCRSPVVVVPTADVASLPDPIEVRISVAEPRVELEPGRSDHEVLDLAGLERNRVWVKCESKLKRIWSI